MPINGIVTVTPTGVVAVGSGSSASINTNGSVAFSSCTSLSLNGVFSSAYDSYMISYNGNASGGSGSQNISLRLRSGVQDNSTASSYAFCKINASSTTVTAVATATSTSGECWTSNGSYFSTNVNMYLFAPFLAQGTAWRSVTYNSDLYAILHEHAGTHNQTVSYDGITFIASAITFGGTIAVYGFNQ